MVNLYAYTYPNYENVKPGYILTKCGDSIRDVDIRMNEQGGAAEAFAKVIVGSWPGLQKIQRDYEVHDVLKKEGLWHKDGAGTEWFLIPGNTVEEAFEYLDNVVTQLEGHVVRKSVVLRTLQQKALDKAMDIIASGNADTSIIANLCPRFGKTIWSLMLFNAISAEYGNRVMLLPAYWLSVHSSFEKEVAEFNDFRDISVVDASKEGAAEAAQAALNAGQRIVVPISLHGDVDEWKQKHQWIADIDNNDIFMFADEGDFGTHTENQVQKVEFMFAA